MIRNLLEDYGYNRDIAGSIGEGSETLYEQRYKLIIGRGELENLSYKVF